MDRSLQLQVLFISPMLGLVYTQVCIPNITVPNGVVTYTGITSGSVAYVTCNTGFELNGTENATCIPPVWFPDLGTCDQLEDDCGIPPVVANGNTLFNVTTVSSEATITCNSGYTLNGQPTIQCMVSGQWSIGGICDPLNCNKTIVVNNGRILYNGDSATILCNSGYELNGSSMITCLSTGLWSTGGTCEALESSPSMGPALTTMALKSTSERWTMSLGGSHGVTVKTSSLGEEGSPTFTTTALKSTTELLTTSLSGSHAVTVETSSVGKESSPISQFNFTTTTTALKSTTEQGTMSLSGTHIVTIKTSSVGEGTVDGCGSYQWSPYCNELSISNGNFCYTGQKNFQTATAFCDDGYDLKGDPSVQCQSSSGWPTEGVVPSCEIKDCGQPGPLSNGYISLPEGTTYGAVATVGCDEGLTLTGSSEIECMATGIWSELPICIMKETSGLTSLLTTVVTKIYNTTVLTKKNEMSSTASTSNERSTEHTTTLRLDDATRTLQTSAATKTRMTSSRTSRPDESSYKDLEAQEGIVKVRKNNRRLTHIIMKKVISTQLLILTFQGTITRQYLVHLKTK